MRNKICLLLCFSLLSLIGCGGNVNLGGKVTFSDDGSPLTCGRVCFSTENFQAFGDIKPDGTYVVGTLSSNDGIPPGTYKVYISGAVRATETLEGGDVLTEPLIDKKFTSPSTSDLTLTVPSAERRYDIQVERFSQGAKNQR